MPKDKLLKKTAVSTEISVDQTEEWEDLGPVLQDMSLSDQKEEAPKEHSENMLEGINLYVSGRILAGEGEPAQPIPDRPQYIGFDEAYTIEDKKDSGRMRTIKGYLKSYLYKKAKYDKGEGDPILFLESMIDDLERLQDSCEKYRFFRHSLFSYGAQRRREVVGLEQETKERLKTLREAYVNTAEQRYEANLGRDPSIRQRGKIRDVKFDPKKGDLQKLDFKAYTSLSGSEYDAHTEKTYIKNRAKVDLKQNVAYTKEEKALLEEILSYSAYTYTGERVGESWVATGKNFEAGLGWEKWPTLSAMIGAVLFAPAHLGRALYMLYTVNYERSEARALNKIVPALDKVLADPGLSVEKRRIFERYKKRFDTFYSGKLDTKDIPDEKIKDYSNIASYADTQEKWQTSDIDSTISESLFVLRENRKDEALFAHPPCMSDVVQGGMGNCFALSAIAEVVSTDPNAILNMMKDEGDAGVVVKLWHNEPDLSAPDPGPGQERPMTTQPVYFRVNKTVATLSNIGALWVSVLLNAMVAYRQEYPETYHADYKGRSLLKERIVRQKAAGVKELDYGTIAHGGDMAEVFPLLTGKRYKETLRVQGSVYEMTASRSILGMLYEEKKTKEQRKEDMETGAVLEDDFAYYSYTPINEEKPVNVVHHKDILQRLAGDKIAAHQRAIKDIEGREARLRELMQIQEEAADVFASFFVQFCKEKEGYAKYADQVGLARKLYLRPLHLPPRFQTNALFGPDEQIAVLQEAVREFTEGAHANKEVNDRFDAAYDEEMNLRNQNAQRIYTCVQENECEELDYAQEWTTAVRHLRHEQHEGAHDVATAKKLFAKELMELEVLLGGCADLIYFQSKTKLDESDIRGSYIKRRRELEKVTYDQFPEPTMEEQKEVDRFCILAKRTGKTREECFALAKECILASLDKVTGAYEELRDAKMFKIFTGVYSEEALDLYKTIKDGIAQGLHFGAGSRKGAGTRTSRGETNDKGTAGGHAYSVLDVTEVMFNGKLIKMVKVRNPWGAYTTDYSYNEKTDEVTAGTNISVNGGVFMMELTHFWRVFNNVYTVDQ